MTHYCGSARGLSGLVVSALTQQAVAQGYKVVGSMELLGDPLSLVGKVRAAFVVSPPPLGLISEPVLSKTARTNTAKVGGLGKILSRSLSIDTALGMLCA